ncbi:hypothetical protein BDV28DRAFT_143969 [Aspergillus coremiiformis]|uniref:Uncharacterized protein n=1 Tax=Aspergillus coremiiformis TaxID=138285 RepID=A0A5N6YS40_9EURO|nr:hypothetical protein BDV28DRAFT_143969 [Aspergillus coremiiformis]
MLSLCPVLSPSFFLFKLSSHSFIHSFIFILFYFIYLDSIHLGIFLFDRIRFCYLVLCSTDCYHMGNPKYETIIMLIIQFYSAIQFTALDERSILYGHPR